jgi:hypothetical protein
VQVIDASSAVHMDAPGSSDTRYRGELDPASGELVNDRGGGRGDIHVFADGALVGWT